MKKIDVHCHTTKRRLTNTAVKTATIEDIKSKMKKYDIDKTVLMATYFPSTSSGVSNFRLYDWIRNQPDFSMFGSLDFSHYFNQGMSELREMCSRHAISGVKIYLGYQKIDTESKKFSDVVSLAKENNIPLAFHTGYTRFKHMSPNPEILEKSVKENNDVDFILCHLSRPFGKELAEMVNKYDNVFSDTSGLMESTNKKEIPFCTRMVERFLRKCGPDKLLFGTDFPVQTHEDTIKILERAMRGYEDRDRQKVYYGNAKEILRL